MHIETGLAPEGGDGYSPAPLQVVIKSEPMVPRPLGSGIRSTAAIVGTTMVALLAIAAWLEPDPRGLGTHRQLGLPPCTFQWLVGRPCPSCGMTTSWAHLMHGQIGPALATNAGGTALGIVCLITAPWLLAAAVRGRWLGVVPTDRLAATIALVIAGITLVDWLRRLGWSW